MKLIILSTPRAGTRSRRAAQALVLALLLAAAGCATFNPQPREEVPFLERAVTQSRGALTVTVAVPSRDEAKKLFGLDIEKKRIQAVWIDIRNDGPDDYWFMHHGLDPNYFSAHEVAYMHHRKLQGGTNRQLDQHFGGLGIDPAVPPHGRTAGFAFSNLKLGTKEVRIRIFGSERVENFTFFVTVPGFEADWQQVDPDTLYPEDEIVELRTEQDLYDALLTLPCCTTRADGTGKGDPLNIVVIANDDDILGFIRAGWDETEVLTAASGWKTFKAFFGGEYKYSPMSALYVYGRPQELSLQKARDTIHLRNHLRLWVSPWRYQGKRVWVGGISRDIGVYFTTRAWNLTTHAIDPDIDEARTYLTEDLATAQALVKVGLVPGVGAATPEEPHRNLMNAPWWTDGNREVYLMTEDRVPLEKLDYFSWDK
ncbi:MAG: LssY C-terminal domain-containing protein [Deltaproteobacteria bacterium]|nr:LssY C-terminal domain-containing protein [Deltaproteobacteria bacterium]